MEQGKEPTKLDRLFAAKALLKKFEAEVKVLEAECKGDLLEQYEKDGMTTQQRSRFFGTKAGCLSLTPNDTPKREIREYIADVDEVLDWMDETDPDVYGFVRENLEEFCKYHFAKTGEMIPGFNRIEYVCGAGAPVIKLTVKEKVVLPILRESGLLEGSVQYLLGDGE